MKKLWIFILIAGIAFLAVSAYQFYIRPGAGDAAPAFTLKSLDGRQVSLEEFRGRPVLLHFFASWCGTCAREFPSLMEFSKKNAGNNLVILNIAEDENEADVRAFFGGALPDFPVILDTDGRIADDYQSFSLPETVFVDKNGVIAWRKSGMVDWGDATIIKKVEGEL